MPNIKSKIKNVRRIEKRTLFNRSVKNRVRTLAKNILKSLEDYSEEKKEMVDKFFSLYFKAVDKAQKRNIIKKNSAARYKSRMAKIISTAIADKKKES